MPVDPVTAAIVGALVGAAGERLLTPAPAVPPTGLVRVLPVEARLGLMQVPGDGQVVIDGRRYLLAPGVVIRDEHNLAIPPMLVRAPVRVRYQTDAMGAVFRVWILSPAEMALAEAQR